MSQRHSLSLIRGQFIKSVKSEFVCEKIDLLDKFGKPSKSTICYTKDLNYTINKVIAGRKINDPHISISHFVLDCQS